MRSSPLFVVGEVEEEMLDVSEDLDMVRTIAKAGDGRKASEIVAIQVAHVSTLTSFMVFLSGNSRPQNQAIAAAIVEEMNDEFGILRSPQGTAESGWMILDYGSVMVHIMTPKSRLFYNVEGQVRQFTMPEHNFGDSFGI
jgi:ribosome-associated protein